MPVILRSNSGEESFGIELIEATDYASEQGFESDIIISGQHNDGDHSHPLSISVRGLWLRTADLVELRNHITTWIAQPLRRLIADDLTQTFKLARLPAQRLDIAFGPHSDATSHLNPVVTITFSSGNLHGEFHFMTDQSCLGIFVQELSAEL